MRKGFTRQPQPDEPATQVKNYITPGGLERLKDEHRFLLMRDRPAVAEVVTWAAGNGDRSENADYQYGKGGCGGSMADSLSTKESKPGVVARKPERRQRAGESILRGDRALAKAAGEERVVSIVGTDEVDLNRNHISWVSPLGRA